MNSINRHNAKLLAAVVGGGALVAFGAISVAIAQSSASQDNVASGGATVYATAQPTTTTEVVSQSFNKVAPALTGKAPEQWGEQPNRIP